MTEAKQIDAHHQAPLWQGREPIILAGADDEHDSVPLEFDIIFYGADYPVDGLISRLDKKSIYIPTIGEEYGTGDGKPIPGFQRDFVWSKEQSDKFIESLLMGLPVPGIFLAKTLDNRHMVLDGHQRLRSLQLFYEGKALGEHVQKRFQTKTLKGLEDKDKRRLDDSIIHATIIKQESPEGYDSIYHIFERLNSGGRLLTPQQIRMVISHGEFAKLLGELNQNEHWQQLLQRKGKSKDPFLRDVEAVLRFFALYHYGPDKYKNPMKSFLNGFMESRKNINSEDSRQYESLFSRTVEFIISCLGEHAFCDIADANRRKTPKAAIIDSVMVGVAKRLEAGPCTASDEAKARFNTLLSDEKYQDAVNIRTSKAEQVKTRLELSQAAFKTI